MCTSPCWGLLLSFLAGMRQVYTSFVQFLVLKRTLGFSFFFFFFFWDGTSKSKAPRRSLQNCKNLAFSKNIQGWSDSLPTRLVLVRGWCDLIGSLVPVLVVGTKHRPTRHAHTSVVWLFEFLNNFRVLVFSKLWGSKNLSINIIGFFRFQTWGFLTELVIF